MNWMSPLCERIDSGIVLVSDQSELDDYIFLHAPAQQKRDKKIREHILYLVE
jgi:hypothetical protein